MSSLSVVIPTKNRPDHLQRALQQFQSFVPRLELVVVDDGSRPDDARRNRRICTSVSGCRHVRIERSRGASAARNHGLRASGGGYVWFIDDDDYATARTIRDALEAVSVRRGAEILLMPRCVMYDGTAVRLDTPVDEPDKSERYRRCELEVNTSCALFPRRILDRLGGWDEALLALQDTDLFLRAAQVASFACLDTEPIRVDEGAPFRITDAFVRSQIGKVQFLRKHWRTLSVSRRWRYLAQVVGCSPLFRTPRLRVRAALAERKAKLGAAHALPTEARRTNPRSKIPRRDSLPQRGAAP